MEKFQNNSLLEICEIEGKFLYPSSNNLCWPAYEILFFKGVEDILRRPLKTSIFSHIRYVKTSYTHVMASYDMGGTNSSNFEHIYVM